MDIVRQLASVFFVLGLLILVVWILRRRNLVQFRARSSRGRRRRVLESLERLPLSPQHSLHLVRIGDRMVVLAAHSGGCTLLDCRSLPGTEEMQRSEPVVGGDLPGESR